MNNVKSYIFSLFISFFVAAILLCLSAVIFAYTNINDRHLQTFVFGTVMLSVLIGATILARRIKKKGLLFGALFGLIFILLVYIIIVIILNLVLLFPHGWLFNQYQHSTLAQMMVNNTPFFTSNWFVQWLQPK